VILKHVAERDAGVPEAIRGSTPASKASIGSGITSSEMPAPRYWFPGTKGNVERL
jgi:hypothetical protein